MYAITMFNTTGILVCVINISTLKPGGIFNCVAMYNSISSVMTSDFCVNTGHAGGAI